MKSTEQPGSSGAPLGIGAFAARFGLAPHALRHWESVGLLSPARDPAGRRRYGDADAVRVAVVLRGKAAGLSLNTLRALLGAGGARARRALLRGEAETLRHRIAAARTALALVECALECGHDELAACPHFRDALAGPRDAAVHATDSLHTH
ncbi:MerR family transcriptional regulator [Streptomyces cyaneogriseus]|uniref:MerR family transcriptional regulator n=1 Tax=Streptomyces cyaneogriseus TaxID=68192 RepID=UPI0005C82C78|nr:MerR family transcriptional regulator [Streptomyces cyaneogriseus]